MTSRETKKKPVLYFFPGLGADASLAPMHLIPGYEIHWIEWPKRFGASWDGFIRELMDENDIEENAVYVGISFGGLVAQRMAQEIRPRKIIFVGSLQTSRSISFPFRLLSPFVPILPRFCFRLGLLPRWLIRYFFGIKRPEDVGLFYRMAEKLNGMKAKKLVELALSEKDGPDGTIPTLSIHGMNDKIIPAANRFVDIEIHGGGHLISMTHPKQVNEAISKHLPGD
ncbi:MAG: hypothetical protein JWO30_633 [Fibrobacteres bacterium]|nr:hypothetical protein [Fibrobacterota bacterium]